MSGAFVLALALSWQGWVMLAMAASQPRRQLALPAAHGMVLIALRTGGLAVLAGACLSAMAIYGWAIGAVVALFLLPVSGLCFVALFAFHPRASIPLGLAGLLAALCWRMSHPL